MFNEKIFFQEYFQVLIRRRWNIIIFFLILVTTVFIGTLQKTPIYFSKASILIERQKPKVFSLNEVSPMGTNDFYNYKDYYQTQYLILKSKTLIDKVLLRLSNDKESISFKEIDKAVDIVPVKDSQMVNIEVKYKDPEMAAVIANFFVEEYIKYNLERNLEISSYAVKWLEKKIEEQSVKLRESEVALQKYRKENHIDILPLLSKEDAVEEIKAEYVKLQSLFSNYKERYTEDHPKMLELKAQIQSLKSKIDGLGETDINNAVSEYRVLEQKVENEKRVYESLLVRAKEINLSLSLDVNNISIVDRAIINKKPISPNMALNMSIAIFLGIALGMGLAFLIDYLDVTIKTPTDISENLSAYFLGVIPVINKKNYREKDLIVHFDRTSTIAECYRIVRTEILNLIGNISGSKSIIVTSAEPGAGKTLNSVNLSIAFAHNDNKVLLVDVDLRNPQHSKIFKIENKKGLCDYLEENASLDEVLNKTIVDNLSVITAGKLPANPAEILGSKKMDEFIMEAKFKFDIIIFDTPPINIVSDPSIIANKVDVSMLIARSNISRYQLVKRAKEQLEKLKANFLGIVLNDINIVNSGYYGSNYSYHYHYGNNKDVRRTEDFVEKC